MKETPRVVSQMAKFLQKKLIDGENLTKQESEMAVNMAYLLDITYHHRELRHIDHLSLDLVKEAAEGAYKQIGHLK